MGNYQSNRRVLTGCFVVIQAFSMVGLYASGNYDYLRLAIGGLLFWLIYSMVEAKRDWFLHPYIRVIAMISIISDSLLGEYMQLYVTSPIYDRIQHGFGTYSFALWAFVIVSQVSHIPLPPKRLRFILILFLGLGLGALYEIYEFIDDLAFHPVFKNQPSLMDTDLDLISDFVGALLAGTHSVMKSSSKLLATKHHGREEKDSPKFLLIPVPSVTEWVLKLRRKHSKSK